MKAVLTDKLLRAIMTKGRPHAPISDQVTRGLEVRFSQRGEPTFSAIARQHGGKPQPIRLPVGKYPALSLASARERAWPLLRDLRNGIDPRESVRRASAAEATKRSNTYGAIAEEFLKRHAARARTAR